MAKRVFGFGEIAIERTEGYVARPRQRTIETSPVPMHRDWVIFDRSLLFTLAIPTIPTKITPTCVLQLTRAFGAFADHCGHYRTFRVMSDG